MCRYCPFSCKFVGNAVCSCAQHGYSTDYGSQDSRLFCPSTLSQPKHSWWTSEVGFDCRIPEVMSRGDEELRQAKTDPSKCLFRGFVQS